MYLRFFLLFLSIAVWSNGPVLNAMDDDSSSSSAHIGLEVKSMVKRADTLFQNGQYENAYQLFEQVVEQATDDWTRGRALRRLSVMTRKGCGIEADEEKAWELFERALGFLQAYVEGLSDGEEKTSKWSRLGEYCYENGCMPDRYFERAKTFFENALAGPSDYATQVKCNYWLGELLWTGPDAIQDHDQAQKCFTLASQGSGLENIDSRMPRMAQYHLIMMGYLTGSQDHKTTREALQRLIKKVPNSWIAGAASLVLGGMVRYGFGGSSNLKKAAQHYRKAIELAAVNPAAATMAQFGLGCLHCLCVDKAQTQFEQGGTASEQSRLMGQAFIAYSSAMDCYQAVCEQTGTAYTYLRPAALYHWARLLEQLKKSGSLPHINDKDESVLYQEVYEEWKRLEPTVVGGKRNPVWGSLDKDLLTIVAGALTYEGQGGARRDSEEARKLFERVAQSQHPEMQYRVAEITAYLDKPFATPQV